MIDLFFYAQEMAQEIMHINVSLSSDCNMWCMEVTIK